MRRDLGGALRALAVPTLALLVVGTFAPGRLELAVRIDALVVSAVALVLALRALRRSYPQVRPLARPRYEIPATNARPRAWPASSTRSRSASPGASTSIFRLVPRVRAIAVGLLASRRRLDLDAEPETARDILGLGTWELVRADRPSPNDHRRARGLPTSDLHRIVQSLEEI